jgi:hypothetical protein
LKADLDGAGIVTKVRRASDSSRYGGQPLARGAIYLMLQNRISYVDRTLRGEKLATKFEMTINLQDRHGARPDRAEHATGVGRGYRISAIHTSCARASFSIKYISDCVK